MAVVAGEGKRLELPTAKLRLIRTFYIRSGAWEAGGNMDPVLGTFWDTIYDVLN